MKTQISKIFFVVGATIISLGLFSPINAQAQQTTFNNLSNDRPTIQVSNHTNNPGCTSCWSTSVSADPGDVIAVYIYYHNTGTVTANSTKLKLNVNQGLDASSHTITGSVSATNANTVNGSSTINLSGSETLTFDNYVRWYPNHQITNPGTIPFGQNISAVLSGSGINIGNIAPDAPIGSFSTQGSMVVHFRVSDTYVPPQQVNCSIDTFDAQPSTVNYGYYSNLSWNTTNCNNITLVGPGLNLSNLNADYAVSTGALYNPTNTYTLTGYGDNGMVQRTKTVTVTGQPANNCVINDFYADPSQVDEGDDTILYWTTTNCNSVSVNGGSISQSNLNDDGNIDTNSLYNDTTFILTAYGNSGSVTDTVIVYVDEDNNNNNDDCEIDEFYADPDEVEEGDDSTLFWETSNCTDVDISNGVGDVSDDGDEEINNINEDETFTITASNSNSSDSKTITIEVDEDNNEQCEVDDFYASPSSVVYGGSTNLYWETTNGEDVYISSYGYNSDDEGHIQISNIYAATTYTITVYCDGDSDSDSVTVSVHQQPISETLAVTTVGASNVGRTTASLVGAIAHTGASSVSAGFEYWAVQAPGLLPVKLVTDQTSFYGTVNSGYTKNISGLLSDTTYMFRAYATGSTGTIYGEVKSFRTLTASAPVNTNTVIYVNSGTGESLLNLELTSAFENVGIGEQYDIDIAYENTSSTVTARDTTLTIVLPKNLIFQRISRGEYNLKDHTIFVDLEDVSPKEKGEITLQVRVGAKAVNGELLVTIGTLNYEKNGVKEEVIDILTNKVTADGSVLGAFALGGGFWPNTLIGWLILLIVFLMIVYIANKMFRRKNVAQPMAVPVPPQTYR